MSFVEVKNLIKRFGAEVAVSGISFGVERGEFVTLLGPSGCGKTTTLRCIAGLERPDGGDILIDGDVVTSVGRGVHLNPEERNLGMVFQSYAVWPHMTVFENVAFGLKVLRRRTSRAELTKMTNRALELVGMRSLADRYATKLSGGQRQRVALARAVVYNPRVVLFDEPLSNLDAKLREQMRIELTRLQREVGITSIYVTHDQSEALVMSDRVVVMNKGVIEQTADPEAIYARPANAFVANFIGVANLLDGTIVGRESGTTLVEIPLGTGHPPALFRVAGAEGIGKGERFILSLRPEDLSLHPNRPEGSLNVMEGEILDTNYLGSFLHCNVRVGRYEINVQMDNFEQFSHEDLSRGRRVYLTFHPEHGVCLTGESIDSN